MLVTLVHTRTPISVSLSTLQLASSLDRTSTNFVTIRMKTLRMREVLQLTKCINNVVVVVF